MCLNEFGKAIGKGTGSRSGADFFKECVWAEADFASDCTKLCTKSYGTALVKPRIGIVTAFAKD